MSITISNKAATTMAAPQQATTSVAKTAATSTAPTVANAAQRAPASDKVTLGAPVTAPTTYADMRKTPMTAADLSALLAESDRAAQKIIDLILPLIQQQGLNLAKVVSGEQSINADPVAIAQAQAAIADDGQFGVQQVADRILGFASSVIGNDPTRIEAVRAAVQDGFDQAARMLGGTLPDISEKTRAVIMATFDQWQSAGATGAASQPAPAGQSGNPA
jgi:hypothetical protein